MPVSDKLKCIFIHIPKASGSSVEYLLGLNNLTLLSKYNNSDKYAPQHLPYEELKKQIPEEKWNTYFKFTFVRNPWDRAVSDFFWLNRGFKSFDEYVHYIRDTLSRPDYMNDADTPVKCKGHFTPQIEYVRNDVTVYHTEKFESGMMDVCKRLNIIYKSTHRNRTNHKHYSEYYTPELRDIIATLYKDDIDKFNYTFDGTPSAIPMLPINDRLKQIGENINNKKYTDLLTTFYEEKLTIKQLWEYYRLNMIVNKSNPGIGQTFYQKFMTKCSNMEFMLECYNNKSKIHECLTTYMPPIIAANIFSQNFVICSTLNDDLHIGNYLSKVATAISYALKTNRLFICMPWKHANNLNLDVLPLVRQDKDTITKLSQQSIQHKEKSLIFSEIINYNDIVVDLVGNFQSEQYFKMHEKNIKHILTWNSSIVNKSKNLIPINKTTCSIHVKKHSRTKTNNSYCQLQENYYTKAIQYILSKESNTHFYIFSDSNCDTLKTNLLKSCSLTNDRFTIMTGRSDIEDLYLMSQCQHNITANSTFSWWGAWLNKNSNKIICRPTKYFIKSDEIHKEDTLYPDSWIKIDN